MRQIPIWQRILFILIGLSMIAVGVNAFRTGMYVAGSDINPQPALVNGALAKYCAGALCLAGLSTVIFSFYGKRR